MDGVYCNLAPALQISSASSSRLPHYLHYWDYLGRWETDDDEEEASDTRASCGDRRRSNT